MTSLELTVASPRDSGTRRIVAEHYPFVLGRALENDLPLPFDSISGRHLTIESVGRGTVRLTDLESTNGTHIDDRTLPPGQTVTVELPVRLRLGDITVTLRRLEEEEQTAFTMAQSSTRLREMVDEAARQANSEDGEQPFFEVLSGPDQGRRHPVEPGAETTIGTGAEADIEMPLDDPVGRIATVEWRDSRCWVVADSGVVDFDQAPLDDERRLRSGDRLTIGPAVLLFFDPLEEALEALEPGLHEKNSPRDSSADPAAPASETPDAPSRQTESTPDDAPRTAGPDSASAPNAEKPAPESGASDSEAGFGIVELALLAMSIFFLIGTVALLVFFLSA